MGKSAENEAGLERPNYTQVFSPAVHISGVGFQMQKDIFVNPIKFFKPRFKPPINFPDYG
jgi:hypothetical protein